MLFSKASGAWALAAVTFLTGCANLSDWNSQWFATAEQYGSNQTMQVTNIQQHPLGTDANTSSLNDPFVHNQAQVDAFGSIGGDGRYSSNTAVYRGQALTKHVGDYVQNMAQDLIANMEYLTDKTPIGVTNFALIDSDLQQTNILGYQLAESFMHELHKFRIPVIDFKATQYIRVTDTGDFLLSRDFLELKNTVGIDYVLTGTMTKHQGGYIVNARILGIQSKAVVASAQMLLPFYIVDALMPTNDGLIDGVKIMKGE